MTTSQDVTRGAGATAGEDVRWERFLVASGLLFAILCGLGLEVFSPQPPNFDASAATTAQYYVENRTGVLLQVTLCGIAMAFLLAWSIQLGAMLWRQAGTPRIGVVVAIVSLCASPILLGFDEIFFAMAAYRAGHISPEITQTLSDVAWIGSMIIWPQLCFAMAAVGVLILRGSSTVFPKWVGWLSIVAALIEPFQLGVVFTFSGAFGPRGWTSWYAAVFSWGAWIVALTFVMWRGLPSRRSVASGLAASGDSERRSEPATLSPGPSLR